MRRKVAIAGLIFAIAMGSLDTFKTDSAALDFPDTEYRRVSVPKEIKRRIKAEIINTEINIPPTLNNIATGFLSTNNHKFYYIKSTNKIFFQENNIKVLIKDIDYKSDGFVLELISPTQGEGDIRIIYMFRENLKLTYEDISSTVHSIFSEDINRFVLANKSTMTYHVGTSNHAPNDHLTTKMSIDDAILNGYKPCGFCFMSFSYLPFHDIEHSLAKKAASEMLYNSPLLLDISAQNYIKSLGKRILDKWPIKLIGYKYKFQVVDNEEPNAFALPGGHIMVTSALLKAVENEAELEGIIAHEIAHVERRHTLREYLRILKKQNRQAFLLAIMGVVAAASDNENASQTIAAVAVAATLAIEVIYSQGYSKEFEFEADELSYLYFIMNNMDKNILTNIFRKIAFKNLIQGHKPDPKSDSHPVLADRVEFIEKAEILPYDNENYIYEDDKGRFIVSLIYKSFFKGESTILFYIDDYHAFNSLKYPSYFVSIIAVSGVNKYKLSTNDIDTIRDQWGAYYINREKERIGEIDEVFIILEEHQVFASSDDAAKTKKIKLQKAE